jgi:MoaA/NifB/PqqE/SkfB family radical SAM enzyme
MASALSKEICKHTPGVKAALVPEPGRLRFVNWYLHHECNLNCGYCRCPRHPTTIMSTEQRGQALVRLRQLASREAILSIIGGEPTLRPELLLEAVSNASELGFSVSMVSNGYQLNSALLEQLSHAGLGYLAVSVDCNTGALKRDLDGALAHLAVAKRLGIVPVINTTVTRAVDYSTFRLFVRTVVGEGYFVHPLVCSPKVPGGAFSNSPEHWVPTNRLLRQIVPWLWWQKLTTGRITAAFPYLSRLPGLGAFEGGDVRLWHCSPHFRARAGGNGRGYLTLDSDGYVGPCQEYPRLANLLHIPPEELSLQSLDERFSQTTRRCPGCLHSCYVSEEGYRASVVVVAELPTYISVMSAMSRRPQAHTQVQ